MDNVHGGVGLGESVQEISTNEEMHKNQSTAQAQTRKRKHAVGIEEIYADKEICVDKENYIEEEIYIKEGICAKYVTYVEKGNYMEGICRRVKK